MKNKLLLSYLFLVFSTIMTFACRPVRTPYKDLLENYNAKMNIIVEGYYQENTQKTGVVFYVTKSSDPTIKTKKEYKVFEYGPFGSRCEMYEMEAHVDSKIIGKDKPRLLILYKDRSNTEKLVTPIFWDAGADASNNKIKTTEYDYSNNKTFFNECVIRLAEVWKKIASENTKGLSWKKANS
ncbi:hypothetical protein [Soonwooa sp.]|uniref:hypothetical protein n=1 Tax=Soonwooa sp. TaxID=1938592 RepID=UPI0026196E12|nr:hypothetical protein [Soonwooa sp.]